MFEAKLMGKTIQQLRIRKNLSQEVFSGLAGMNKSHLGRIERGERKANLDTLCKIASALGMLPHELVEAFENAAHANG